MESNRLLPSVTEARNSHSGKGFKYKSLALFKKSTPLWPVVAQKNVAARESG
jgi:hypothetical protein